MIASLRFRRQFLVATETLDMDEWWRCIPCGHLYLYVHRDLQLTQAGRPGRSLWLLGDVYDPEVPVADNDSVVASVLDASRSVDDVLRACERLVGCYVALFRSGGSMAAFTDARGMREVYYSTAPNRVRIASQPHLLARVAHPPVMASTRAELSEYTRQHLRDSRWIGDETAFEGIKHLLPNHWLDVNEGRASRYWPWKPVLKQSPTAAAASISRLLRGSIEAMVTRHPVMMALTAGTDSRTLLAASKGVRDRVEYFVNDENLGVAHPDIVVPRRMCAALNLPFRVNAVPQAVDASFRRTFYENTHLADERLLPAIYGVYYRQDPVRRCMQGIGEVGRTFYGTAPRRLVPFLVASKLGYARSEYALRQAAKICAELGAAAAVGHINVMALLYWEQRLGNWAATRVSESLIAIDKIDPFNSHRIYELMLGVSDTHKNFERDICPLFRLLVQEMWPELLRWPVNPPFSFRTRTVALLRRSGLYAVGRELNYRLKYTRYAVSRMAFYGERVE
jgi:hypothetical protein